MHGKKEIAGFRQEYQARVHTQHDELRLCLIQGVDVGWIFDTGGSTRDPPEGAIFWKSRPPYAMIDVRTVVFFFIVVVIVKINSHRLIRSGTYIPYVQY